MAEKIFLCARFNLDALLSLAGSIRGRTCTCDVSAAPKTGSLNWAVFVSFEDGIEWVFRSPRTGPHAIVSEESARKMLVSEAATLKFLRACSPVPVPEVFSFNGSYDNPIGVPYILMSKAAGRALSDYDWAQISRQTPGYPSLRHLLPLSDENREKVMRQLGAIMAQLSILHFDSIGSLIQDSDNNYVVGECLSPTLLWQWRDSIEGLDRGPFRKEVQYLDSLISAFTSHAMELPLTPHVFFAPVPDHSEYPDWTSYRAAVRRWNDFVAIGAKDESAKNRLSYCIAGQFLRDMIPRISTADGHFTLSHPDLHLGNIFVDEEFNITCIIDWGSTTSGPITELLATPGLGKSASPPSEQSIAAFRSGFSQESQHGLDYWEKADMMWHFSRLVRLLSTQDYELFRALYKLVQSAGSEEPDIPRLFYERAEEEDNQQLFTILSADDITELELKQEEDAAFGKADKTDGRAVARKLTLMSELNRGFLANTKTWRWIELALEQADSV
ncbi:hypothetical protein HIM_06846 [Hirsutella minnesotensis 3608]|uniref:Aminoglycoside phosphotransferase domain-containing protein n=1 Tax=Hirsutella minnesotensis 3608 TaxID=1043627 RepID=A0A0F7ZTU6_9HYPO|nr:hypothetical protein HIM_06846 [Hirsutella minnesotensis 3608]